MVAMLEEQSSRFPGVSYSMERVRMYPRGLGTEAFTGYVGEVSPDELKNLSPELYRLGSTIGKKGLEKQYDQLLRGREGTKYVEVFASGQILGDYAGRPVDPGTPGSDLVLTIDMDLQAACAQALDTFCCGAIVAMDPRSGEVLALASYPGFDANIFSSVIPDSLWREIRGDSTHPLLNRPLNGLYPPGSTVKFVTVGAGMMEGLINENSRLNPCLGGMQFGNRFFRCWQAGGHGSLNGAHALEQSCDVFMYQLGLKLGIDKLSEYFDGCGFGKLTGIDLPGEAAGLNPNSAYYNERYGRNKWTRALVLNNSIGQGELLVTPIQLAQFFCGLANRGIVFRPHLLKSRRLPDGRIVETAPEVSFNLPFSERTLAYLKEGMRLVVEGKQGTARALRDPRYHFGGKTGTAQNPHGENHSWFVGVAPLDAPEIVVAAIVENAGEGSAVAAPLVKKILDAYMAKTDSTFALQAPNPETAE
ncbi:MAG: penicillin-binding protein 2 [Candidatus Zixiibacteriota bacterium]|nr:MAG: penicillin-binding protein 2 [candidate division Zixibacteria bacterium]